MRPLLDRRVSVSVRSATIDELLSAVLKGTELTGRVRENQVIISKAPARKNAAVTPPLPAANSGREIVLQGTVISSADNKPIVGVSVYVEGTTVGATSDINGNYTLKVPAGTKHVTFAFLGYDTKKIAVADVELFKLVTLIEASNVMDDVVVVAFGTQKKESLVGAVQVVRPSTLKVTSSNLSTSFAGKIAGVISTQSSGEPGADGANFWIRGISTFGANKSPLLILDGVEIVSEMLNNIPPEAIESFSILRDATATALYGSRGANGVMIITTKNGRQSEKMAINVRLESGISMPTRVQDIADGVTYMENYNEALRTRTPAGETYVQHFSDEKITGTRNRLNPYVYPDNDWYSMLFKDFTVNENMNLNVRGGGKVVDYFLNASIFNENGILKKPAESKFNTNINSQKYLFQANVGAQLTRTTRESEDEHATAFLAPSRRRGERPVLLYDARQSGRFPGHLSQRLRGGSRRPDFRKCPFVGRWFYGHQSLCPVEPRIRTAPYAVHHHDLLGGPGPRFRHQGTEGSGHGLVLQQDLCGDLPFFFSLLLRNDRLYRQRRRDFRLQPAKHRHARIVLSGNLHGAERLP